MSKNNVHVVLNFDRQMDEKFKQMFMRNKKKQNPKYTQI